MTKSNIAILLGWLTLTLFFTFEDFNAGVLWFALSSSFGLLLYFSIKTKQIVTKLFFAMVFITHAILPPMFLLKKESFTYSGWAAVKNFDFELHSFLPIYLVLFIFYLGLLLFCFLFTNKLSVCNFKKNLPKKIQIVSKKDVQVKYDLLIIIFLLAVGSLNVWMFNSNIGLTGMGGVQEYLPFKLGGILYYFSRFIIPIAIYYLYKKSTRNTYVTIVLFLYAFFASLSHVSKATFVLLIIPLMWFSIKDKKLWIFLFIVFGSAVTYPLIEFSRTFVYEVSDGVVFRNSSDSIFSLIIKVICDFPEIDLGSTIYSFIARLGGGQDVVLSWQYNPAEIGRNFLVEFERIFFNQLGDFDSTYELYGFKAPFGFSAGSGGFSAMMLQIVGQQYWLLLFLIIWVGFLLILGEWVAIQYEIKFKSSEIRQVVAFLYTLFLYALGNMLVFQFYILVIFSFLIMASSFKIFKRNRKKIHDSI